MCRVSSISKTMVECIELHQPSLVLLYVQLQRPGLSTDVLQELETPRLFTTQVIRWAFWYLWQTRKKRRSIRSRWRGQSFGRWTDSPLIERMNINIDHAILGVIEIYLTDNHHWLVYGCFNAIMLLLDIVMNHVIPMSRF